MIEASMLGEYLSSLASRLATPGGGAAAGVTGAQACALIAMVCRLTKGHEERIELITSTADNAQAKFLALADQDMQVFQAVMTANGLPKKERTEPLQAALINAARVPLAMIQQSIDLAPHLQELVTIGNKNLITDTGIAARLLEATIHSSRLNVLINTRAIEDEEFVASAQATIAHGATAIELLANINASVDEQLN